MPVVPRAATQLDGGDITATKQVGADGCLMMQQNTAAHLPALAAGSCTTTSLVVTVRTQESGQWIYQSGWGKRPNERDKFNGRPSCRLDLGNCVLSVSVVTARRRRVTSWRRRCT